jgi:hypothetical protein
MSPRKRRGRDRGRSKSAGNEQDHHQAELLVLDGDNNNLKASSISSQLNLNNRSLGWSQGAAPVHQVGQQRAAVASDAPTISTSGNSIVHVGTMTMAVLEEDNDNHIACADVTVNVLQLQLSRSYYSNGLLRYEGHINAHTRLKHGHGMHVDKCGNQYEGAFINDKRHGWGTYSFFPSGNYYRGQFQEGCFHGYGTHVWKVDQKVLNGNTRGSKSRRHYSFDETTRRSTRSGSRSGSAYGTYNEAATAVTDIYHGQWKGNAMHGYGVKTLHNGDTYDGYWQDNAAHGWGRKEFGSVGEHHEGIYKKDKVHTFLSLLLLSVDRFVIIIICDCSSKKCAHLY